MFSQKQKFLHTPQKKYLSQKYLPKLGINREFLNISYIYVEQKFLKHRYIYPRGSR